MGQTEKTALEMLQNARNPEKHDFVEWVGSREGEDSCVLCDHPKSQHVVSPDVPQRECQYCGSDPLAAYKLRRLEAIDHAAHIKSILSPAAPVAAAPSIAYEEGFNHGYTEGYQNGQIDGALPSAGQKDVIPLELLKACGKWLRETYPQLPFRDDLDGVSLAEFVAQRERATASPDILARIDSLIKTWLLFAANVSSSWQYDAGFKSAMSTCCEELGKLRDELKREPPLNEAGESSQIRPAGKMPPAGAH